MRKRVLFFTSIVVFSSLMLSTQVEAVAVPTRESARVAPAPVSLRIDTSASRLQNAVVAYPTSFRDIFAPLPKQPIATPVLQSPAPRTYATGEFAQITREAVPVLRLAAMVDTVLYQEAEEAFSAEEKEYYDRLLATTFSKFPPEYVDQLERLTLKKTRTGSRGLAGAAVMILRTVGVPENDFVAVAIHELGHIIDMGAITGEDIYGASSFMDGATPVWSNDASLAFYTISWDTDLVRRSENSLDFVSGYAMTDPFEDFAESFAMYVLHGDRFALLAQNNEALAKKYAYIRDTVFTGREFRGISAIPFTTSLMERPWDVTIQPYNKIAFDALAAW